MDRMLDKLKVFDAYPKTLEDFRIKTISGGIVTAISSIVMLSLFALEVQAYFKLDVRPELTVDVDRSSRLEIHLNITFPRMACKLVTLDAVDVSGEQHFDISHEVFKTNLDVNGNVKREKKEEIKKLQSNNMTALVTPKPSCGSCYGAESDVFKCCNTCEDVKKAYFAKGWALKDFSGIAQCGKEQAEVIPEEGCRVEGTLKVSKISGSFHLVPGSSYEQSHAHVHDFQKIANREFNSTHMIHHLSFGHIYPDMHNPLDNTYEVSSEMNLMHTYYVKLVPTTYISLKGSPLSTHQYSVTKHEAKINFAALTNGLPGVFIQYEFSPIMVKLRETPQSFGHLLTALCSIIGGVFTVASLLDAFIFQTSRVVNRKLDIGKFSH